MQNMNVTIFLGKDGPHGFKDNLSDWKLGTITNSKANTEHTKDIGVQYKKETIPL